MQCLKPCPEAQYRNIIDALNQIVKREGISRTMRGIQAVIGGAGPAHALYFACYEKLKWLFRDKQVTEGHHVLANGTYSETDRVVISHRQDCICFLLIVCSDTDLSCDCT